MATGMLNAAASAPPPRAAAEPAVARVAAARNGRSIAPSSAGAAAGTGTRSAAPPARRCLPSCCRPRRARAVDAPRLGVPQLAAGDVLSHPRPAGPGARRDHRRRGPRPALVQVASFPFPFSGRGFSGKKGAAPWAPPMQLHRPVVRYGGHRGRSLGAHWEQQRMWRGGGGCFWWRARVSPQKHGVPAVA